MKHARVTLYVSQIWIFGLLQNEIIARHLMIHGHFFNEVISLMLCLSDHVGSRHSYFDITQAFIFYFFPHK